MTAQKTLARCRSLASDRTGSVMLEFTIALPMLLLFVAGTLDLAQYGLQKSALLQGARAGAQYGMASPSDTANINLTAQNATGLTGVTATSSKFCECTSGVTVACGSTCTGGGVPKTYVSVNLTKTFTSVLARSSTTFGSVGTWIPPVSVSGSVTMIVP